MTRDDLLRHAGDTSACRRCGATMLWAWTTSENGGQSRRMPLDPEEHPADDEAANVAVYRDGVGRLRARVLSKDNPLAAFERRHVPHFATCPPLVAERERRASLRKARVAAPSPYDTEALDEARRAAAAHRSLATALERDAGVVDELAERRARRVTRRPAP